MAEPSLSQIKTLDSLRSRLLALRSSLQTLHTDLSHPHQPLPNWTSLQRQTRIILDGIEEVLVQSKQGEELLDTTVVTPTPDFPAQTSDHILNALLRTKLDPSIEEWIEEGKHHSAGQAQRPNVLSEADLGVLWAGAAEIYHTYGSRYPWGADYSREEMENGTQNVVTGLKRELVEPVLEPDEFDNDDDDTDDGSETHQEGEQDRMDVDQHTAIRPKSPVRQPMAAGPVLKFLSISSMG